MRFWRSGWFRRLLGSISEWRAPASVIGAAIVFFVLLMGVLLVAFWPREKIYTLDATTEVAGFVISDALYSEWDVSGATVWLDPFLDQPDIAALEEGALLVLNPGVRVEVQRHGVGPVRIRLECEGCSIGRIEGDERKPVPMGEWAVLRLPLGEKPMVLPFRGHLSIGDDVASHVDSILLQGVVSIVEQRLFSNGHYTAGEENLDPGDRVQFWQSDDSGGKRPGRLDGFVRAEPASFSEAINALQLVAHGQADFARVDRFGSAGYEVHTQPWIRFLNDPALGMLFAALASLALVMEIFFKLIELKKTLSEAQAAGAAEGKVRKNHKKGRDDD